MLQYFSVSPVLYLQVNANPVATICMLLFATTCTYFCWLYWKLNRAYAKFPSLRMEVRGLLTFMLGRYPKNVPFSCAYFREIIKACKMFEKEGFVVLWLFRPHLVIFSKDIIKRFYNEPAAVNKTSLYDPLIDVFGNGLLTSKEEVWKSHRKILNTGFHLGKLKENLRIFNENAVDLVTKLESFVGLPTFDLCGHLKKCTFNIMAECILDLNLKDGKYETKIENYFRALNEMMPILVLRMPLPWLHWNFLLPFFSIGRKYLTLRHNLQRFTQEGHDTTSHCLLWCLYALGLHPDVQEKAFKETEALSETLRVYSVVPLYGRKLNKEIQWENYTIPKGTEITFLLYLLNKSPDIYTDPEKFDPDRFSGNSDLRPWTYMPFAEGYRSCIGKKFAMMEMKIVLAHIIRRFKIETLEEINASDVDWKIVLEPVKPLQLLLTLR